FASLNAAEVIDDGRIVEPGVGAVGQAEKQISADVVDGAGSPACWAALASASMCPLAAATRSTGRSSPDRFAEPSGLRYPTTSRSATACS
ncbi:MAG: hypothetical protein LC749_19095, partial [Actinobacteria bacterium]|nr:hypothetical protein [Actinomycetota bacterium]